MQLLSSFSILLLTFVTCTSAFRISLYTGSKCTSANNGNLVMGPDQGCKKDAAGVASAAVIKSTGPVDDTFYTVFFSSDDCNPDTVIAKGDSGCVAAGYKSFAVWNVCPDGKTDCI